MLRLCLVLLLVAFASMASPAKDVVCRVPGKVFFSKDSLTVSSDTVRPRKHRLIAALLAFPIPFGVFGAHRIYLGSSAAIPLVYIATFGGAFGILPFIDFVLIVLNKDVNSYAHNSHLFMWTRRKQEKK